MINKSGTNFVNLVLIQDVRRLLLRWGGFRRPEGVSGGRLLIGVVATQLVLICVCVSMGIRRPAHAKTSTKFRVSIPNCRKKIPKRLWARKLVCYCFIEQINNRNYSKDCKQHQPSRPLNLLPFRVPFPSFSVVGVVSLCPLSGFVCCLSFLGLLSSCCISCRRCSSSSQSKLVSS